MLQALKSCFPDNLLPLSDGTQFSVHHFGLFLRMIWQFWADIHVLQKQYLISKPFHVKERKKHSVWKVNLAELL